MKKSLGLICAVVSLCALGGGAAGADDTVVVTSIDAVPMAGAVQLGEVVVTAERTPTDIRRSGSSVTVITHEDLEKRGVSSVLELLRDEPGVQVTTSGGIGTTTGVRIRGANDVHTLVLLDGVRIHSNTLGTGVLQNLTLDNIDRIEIVRGPQSTLYGSDAMGGVIQIFTKKGIENRTTIAYEGGSYNTNLVRASTQGVTENQSFSIAGSWQEQDGYSRFSENRGAIEDDGYRNQSVSATYNRTGWLDIGTHMEYSAGAIDLDETARDNRSRFSENRNWLLGLDLSRQFGERWFHKAAFSGFRDEQNGNTGADFKIVSVTQAAKWQSEFKLSDGFRLIGGFESEKQIGESSSGRFAKFNITNSGYLEGAFNFRDQFHMTLGGRHDNHSTFGAHNTWRTTATYNGFKNTRIFGSYGTGFRAPTFNQLFFAGSSDVNLLPEESKGWDAGVEHLFGERLLFRATYFENAFENLIEFPSPTFIARNVSRAATSGVELSAKLSIRDNLAFDAQWTLLDARDEITHWQLQRRPETVFSAHLSYNPTTSLSLDAYYRNVGKSFSATNERSRVDGFDLLAASLAYTWRDRHKVWVRGENIMDKDYEEILNFGTAGAAFYGGYELSF